MVTNKSKNNVFKLISLLFLSLVFGVVSVNAVVISNCDIIPINNTNYEISDTWSYNSNNCFNFYKLENITIDGKNKYFPYSLSVNGVLSKNITFKNFIVDSVSFGGIQSSINFKIYNNYFKNQNDYIINVNGGANIYNFSMINNTIITTKSILHARQDNAAFVTVKFIKSSYINNDFIIKNSQYFDYAESPNFGYAWYKSLIYFSDSFIFENNNIGINNILFSHPTSSSLSNNFNYGTYFDCLNVSFVNNYDSYFYNGNMPKDSDYNFITDDIIEYKYGSCVLSNTFTNTKSIPNHKKNFLNNSIFLGLMYQNSAVYENYKNYIITTTQELNSSYYININTRHNNIIDISNLGGLNGINAFIVDNINVIRLGSNNNINGGINTIKPTIKVNKQIIAQYNETNVFSSIWGLITIGNYNTINGINFDMGSYSGSNFGLIQPNAIYKGDYLSFEDNIVTYTQSMNNYNIPTIQYKNTIKSINNDFVINNKTSVIFASNGEYGGSIFQDNTFSGIKSAFSKVLSYSGTVKKNIANHNYFLLWSTMYSYPFNMDSTDILVNADGFNLNGSYYYKSGCDAYDFNIGNYYQDLDDNSLFNDSNRDFINDYPILRTGSGLFEIYDNRGLLTPAYDFSSQTGSVIPVDICGTINFDIQSPISLQTYTSNIVNSKWAYNSATFDDLNCRIKLNDETIIYDNTPKATYKENGLNLTNGYYNYNLICENDYISFDSEVIYFCVNNCDFEGTFNGIVENVTTVDVFGCTDSTATNYNPLATIDDGSCTGGTGVYGCTDSTATNYNPLATIDDGSCTYSTTGGTGGVTDVDTGSSVFGGNLFGGDVVDTSNSIKSMFGFMEIPSSVLLYIGYVFIFLSIIFVVFALIMIMV